MKTTLQTLLTIAVLAFSNQLLAQREMVKKEVKSIKKEISMTEKNGEKKLTIRTEENGKETIEEYIGEEADKKMQEIQSGELNEMQLTPSSEHSESVFEVEDAPSEIYVSEKKEMKRIDVRESNGKTTLIINELVDGKWEETVYKGRKAKKKMKELDLPMIGGREK